MLRQSSGLSRAFSGLCRAIPATHTTYYRTPVRRYLNNARSFTYHTSITHHIARTLSTSSASTRRSSFPDYEPCKVCYPWTPPTHDRPSSSARRCGNAYQNEVDHTWITAHNQQKCCGHEHRTLVLCFDGTGEQFDESSSNVVRFCSMLKKSDNGRQLVYYQSGIGTYVDPLGFHTPIWPKLSLLLDQMFAWNLENHIKDGYSFLMQNYTEGDKICLIGYSRGAYTARALAAMLEKVGLLPVSNQRQLQSAYQLYVREDESGLKLAERFKELYTRSVSVEFLGLWDTVASVGLTSRHLPLFENTGIRYLRHAVALDERRLKFIPQFCYDFSPGDDSAVQRPIAEQFFELIDKFDGGTEVEEVWFAGVHTDVGGGAFDDNELNTPRLSRIPLRWMIRQCFESNTGIIFDACMLQEAGLPVYREADNHGSYVYQLAPSYTWSPSSPSVPSQKAQPTLAKFPAYCRALSRFVQRVLFGWSSPEKIIPDKFEWRDLPPDWEEKHDQVDMSQEIHCQLEESPLWWLLELIPWSFETTMVEKLKSGDSYTWIWNLGKGRRMFDHTAPGPWKVHRTVKMRLEQNTSYAPHTRPELQVVRQDDRELRREVTARRLYNEEWNHDKLTEWTWVPFPEKPIS